MMHAAIFGVVRIESSKVIITQVGNVGIRINGQKVLLNEHKIDPIMAQMRVDAMRKAKQENPTISNDELLEIGRQAISESLKEQVTKYYNNPNEELGHGVIDGREVPVKFIKVIELDLRDIDTIEIFSDGYFKVPQEVSIAAWERTFEEVENEDSLKWNSYPSTKGSTTSQCTDDRTILIARFKK